MERLMDKPSRNTKQVRAAREFLHCVILEQRAATEELKASNRELEFLLEDLVSSRNDLKHLAVDGEQEAGLEAGNGARRRREPDPPDQTLMQLRREIEAVLEEGAAAVRDSVRLRQRARKLRDALQAGRPAPEAPAAGLSRREHQVLTLMVQGKTSKEIAAELGISFKTAVTHRASIMSKLDVHEVASVVREAIRRGLV
jgi:DNA-binding CsgD family transcriptional regulator